LSELLTAAAIADEAVRGGPAAPAVIVRGDGPLALAGARAAAGAGAVAVALLGDVATPSDASAAPPPGSAPADASDAAAPLFASPDLDAVRAWIAPRSARGRADLVLAADGDLAAAAKLVRRGGAIAALADPTARPSVTTLVQRELELLQPRALPPTDPPRPTPHPGGPDGS